MRDIITVLYDDFETLDVFGPIEVFGRLPGEFNLLFYSLDGGIVTSTQKVPVMTEPIGKLDSSGFILFVPGGIGTRDMEHDPAIISALRRLASDAAFILSVCTGSMLLARAGILDNRRATSNKRAFAWTRTAPSVNWVKRARWVRDGNIYTSSGVSAGTDMALGFVADQIGRGQAEQVAREIEYTWNPDPADDPFADLYP